MTLKATYDKVDDIPTEYQSLYSERDGKMELTGITGIKTDADVQRVQEGLRKEKSDHKSTKDKLTPWTALNIPVEDVTKSLDRIPELEAAAKGDINEEDIEKIVEGRVKTRIAPVERELNAVKGENTTLKESVTSFKTKDKRRLISDAVRTAGTNLQIIPQAFDDVVMLGEHSLEVNDDGKVVTKDANGLVPGLDVESWLSDLRDKKAYWWPGSSGGGAGGGGGGQGGGNNPWSKEHWSLTAQGAVVKTKGMEQATKLAKAAGSSIGATKPAVRKA